MAEYETGKSRFIGLFRNISLVMAPVFAILLFFPLFVRAADFLPAAADISECASEIAGGVTVTVTGGQNPAALTDGSRATWLNLEQGAEITISSGSPVFSLYLVWNKPPAPWSFNAGDTAAAFGKEGFLHEWAALPLPTTEFSVRLTVASAELCDIYLFGEGTAPDWVQCWQPPCAKADLLALPTHADDEHLFFGGILPTYAGQRQLAVQVVYLTNHWGEPYRPHELLDGLWTVGVTSYPVIGPFPDMYASLESLAAAEGVYSKDDVLAFQVEQLRRFKPQVVVGHDLNGEYGHGAHKLNAVTLTEAINISADAAIYAESAARYGVWTPEKVYLHLYPENRLEMDWNRPLSRFGGATAFEMAVAGFANHTSQRNYFQVTQGGTWEDCRQFGLVYTAVGADVIGGDLFENIVVKKQAAAEVSSASQAPPALSSAASAPSPAPPSVPDIVRQAILPAESTFAPGTPPKAASSALWPFAAAGIALMLLISSVAALTLRSRRKQ